MRKIFMALMVLGISSGYASSGQTSQFVSARKETEVWSRRATDYENAAIEQLLSAGGGVVRSLLCPGSRVNPIPTWWSQSKQGKRYAAGESARVAELHGLQRAYEDARGRIFRSMWATVRRGKRADGAYAKILHQAVATVPGARITQLAHNGIAIELTTSEGKKIEIVFQVLGWFRNDQGLSALYFPAAWEEAPERSVMGRVKWPEVFPYRFAGDDDAPRDDDHYAVVYRIPYGALNEEESTQIVRTLGITHPSLWKELYDEYAARGVWDKVENYHRTRVVYDGSGNIAALYLLRHVYPGIGGHVVSTPLAERIAREVELNRQVGHDELDAFIVSPAQYQRNVWGRRLVVGVATVAALTKLVMPQLGR
jgi:hypothetical protein